MKTKIPFDIELWRTGKYDVVTRDNRKVVSLYLHDIEIDYPLSFVVEDSSTLHTAQKNGNYDKFDTNSERSLFLIPKSRKVWMAIRKAKLGTDKFYITSHAYDNRDHIPVESQCDIYHIIEVELPE